MSSSLPSFLATDPEVYEYFMGRWSARLAPPFLDFTGVKRADKGPELGPPSCASQRQPNCAVEGVVRSRESRPSVRRAPTAYVERLDSRPFLNQAGVRLVDFDVRCQALHGPHQYDPVGAFRP